MPLTAVGKIFKPALRQRAIRWAIEAAAGKVGLEPSDFALSVSEGLEVTVTGPAPALARLRPALTGMPIVMRFEEGPPR